MKKYLCLLIPLFLWGCEKTYITPIEPGQSNYYVKDVSSFAGFSYVPGDSNLTAYITLNTSEGISLVTMNIYSPVDQLNSSAVRLYDDGNLALHGDQTAGDNSYAAKFPLSQYYPNGKYKIEYFVTDKYGTTSKAAVHNFAYNNGQSNIAPALSNLVMADSVVVDTPQTNIPIHVTAADSNGLSDIESVFFITYRPDGSTSGARVALLDDGKTADDGDVTAGDGIYSIIIKVTPSNAKGVYRFEFQAQDRGKKLSDKIIHNILIK